MTSPVHAYTAGLQGSSFDRNASILPGRQHVTLDAAAQSAPAGESTPQRVISTDEP